jgi:nucleoredoxin
VIEEHPIEDILRGQQVVGLYFSASWCGPCKQFTPVLAEFYRDMKKKGKKFEIVWISRDRTAEEFVDYYQSMPWTAAALQNIANISNPLGEKYKLKGIPHFVILDGEDASVYTLDGRTKVLQDKYGLEFPWAPRGLHQLLPKKLRRRVEGILYGALESLAPRRFLEYVGWKLQLYTKRAFHSLYTLLRQKLADIMGAKKKASVS